MNADGTDPVAIVPGFTHQYGDETSLKNCAYELKAAIPTSK